MEQRTPEWHEARRGSLGASEIYNALAKTRSGAYSAARKNIIARMAAERLGGVSEGFITAAMQWGIDTEDSARMAYTLTTGRDVEQVGLYKHPDIEGTHASPDGLVGDDGLIEIKCPNTATHFETLITEVIEPRYVYQMQWQMACTGRHWCDFVSYDPRMADNLQLFIKRVERDETLLDTLQNEVKLLLVEVDDLVQATKAKYGIEEI